MKLLKIYLENFICHEISEIDIAGISSALIVGRINGSDMFSNGTGKSSIFKAIEYVLFNKARDTTLEKLVRDDTNKCKVMLDFEISGKVYRVSRSRTSKGTSDLTLWERNTHIDPSIDPHAASLTEEQVKLFWNNISSRRVFDTEEDLKKLHKMNFEAFVSANHFVQHDYNGLPTATAGNRKKILKEALQVAIYAKLEKATSEEAKLLSKDLDKKKAVVSAIGDPQKDIDALKVKLTDAVDCINSKSIEVENKKIELEDLSFKISELSSKFSSLDAQAASFIKRRDESQIKVKKVQSASDEADQKRRTASNLGRDLIKENNELKEKLVELQATDLSLLDDYKNQFNLLREKIAVDSSTVTSLKVELIDLKIPMPDDSLCKHCRQPLTDAHRRVCANQIQEEIKDKESRVQALQQNIVNDKAEGVKLHNLIKQLEQVQIQIGALTTKVSIKENEISEKVKLHKELNSMWVKLKEDLIEAQTEAEQASNDANLSSEKELTVLRNEISDERQKVISLKKDLDVLSAQLNKYQSDKAIIDHSINEKQKDLIKKDLLDKETIALDENYSIYPDVIEGFSSRGMPNLIIHNILDELQLEANTLLTQLKPGLQLEFAIEKTKGDGEVDDDLEINYFLNGRARDYGQLSGAMRLCVLFSLKLGLSFLLKKKIGASIQFLLIDEIDSALDKAGVDAFAEIIKFFQNDFTIFVITHNDRLKDKFSHAILVEQDRNMITNAKIVSSW